MKLRSCLILLFVGLLPCAAYADETVTDEIGDYLQGQSIQLGVSYAQGTFKMFNSSGSKSTLTDNGRAALILDFTGSEHVIGKIPLKYGSAVLGFNFGGTYGHVSVDKQLTPSTSAIIGQDVGSSINGNYLAAAPFIYLRLGPVYPGTDSYWLAGYGVGGALFNFHGNPVFYNVTPTTGTFTPAFEPVNSGTKLFLYQTWRWQFHYGHWDVLFTAKQLSNQKVMGNPTSYEDYALGVDYSFQF